MPKRAAGINQEQKRTMFEYLRQLPQLTSGKFTAHFSYKDAQQKLYELAGILNSIPMGATKDWKAWRKTWQDIRCRTKTKNSKLNKHASATGGGGPSEDTLSTMDDDVLQIIKVVSVEGHSNVAESIAEFDMTEVTESPNISAMDTGDYVYIMDVPDVPAEAIVTEEAEEPNKLRKVPQKKSKSALKHSVAAVDRFARGCESKLQLKKDFYAKKLQFLERIAAAKERSADTREKKVAVLERIANTLDTIAGASSSREIL